MAHMWLNKSMYKYLNIVFEFYLKKATNCCANQILKNPNRMMYEMGHGIALKNFRSAMSEYPFSKKKRSTLIADDSTEQQSSIPHSN